jgi:hypothetical protein
MSSLAISIAGFKAHPLHVLKRHITKYEVGFGLVFRVCVLKRGGGTI